MLMRTSHLKFRRFISSIATDDNFIIMEACMVTIQPQRSTR